MTMRYKNELIREIREIREELESLYRKDPASASDSFRERILELQWDKKIEKSPEYFRYLLVDLRMAARKHKETYSPKQKEAILQALSLGEKYKELTLEDAKRSRATMKKAGLRIILEGINFPDEEISSIIHNS